MAKSKIIKAFVQNQIDLESMLKQLKLLLCDLGKERFIQWVNYEIEGYPNEENLPKYREYPGVLKGCFLNYNMKCTNVPIPLKNDTPIEVKEYTSKMHFREGVSALKKLQSDSGRIHATIPGDCLLAIQACSAVSMTYLLSAEIEVSNTVSDSILSAIGNKVIDILLLLENEFGCLDELTIDVSKKQEHEIEQIEKSISIILYDNHIELGDNNTIKNSNLNG